MRAARTHAQKSRSRNLWVIMDTTSTGSVPIDILSPLLRTGRQRSTGYHGHFLSLTGRAALVGTPIVNGTEKKVLIGRHYYNTKPAPDKRANPKKNDAGFEIVRRLRRGGRRQNARIGRLPP